MVEDPPVCVGARALRYLGRRFYHLHDQHLRGGAVPAHRLPGGGYAERVFLSGMIAPCSCLSRRHYFAFFSSPDSSWSSFLELVAAHLLFRLHEKHPKMLHVSKQHPNPKSMEKKGIKHTLSVDYFFLCHRSGEYRRAPGDVPGVPGCGGGFGNGDVRNRRV